MQTTPTPAESSGATIIPFPERAISPDLAAFREIIADIEGNDESEYLALAQASMQGLATHQAKKSGDLQGVVNCVAFAFFALGLALGYFKREDI